MAASYKSSGSSSRMVGGKVPDEDDSGSDSGSDFENLFQERVSEDEVFYYRSYSIDASDDDPTSSVINFRYNSCNETDFQAKLNINAPVASIDPRLVFDIGMCVMTWYWMGIGTPRIVIEATFHFDDDNNNNSHKSDAGASVRPPRTYEETRDIVQAYWEHVLHLVLLEFIYVNKLQSKFEGGLKLQFTGGAGGVGAGGRGGGEREGAGAGAGAGATDGRSGMDQPAGSGSSGLLVPLGGGKDSLVVWDMACTEVRNRDRDNGSGRAASLEDRGSGPQVHLLYVADGVHEFASNARLQVVMDMCSRRSTNAGTVPEVENGEGEGVGAVTKPVDRTRQHVAKYSFDYNYIMRHCRSYLEACGHPWAALVTFTSLLVACSVNNTAGSAATTNGSQVGAPIADIAVGFEQSASEGNGIFVGELEVNHQYDKSADFLARTRAYLSKFRPINPAARSSDPVVGVFNIPTAASSPHSTTACSSYPNVYSPLIHTDEFKIAEHFFTRPSLRPFHPHFISCNELATVSNPTYNWCNKCEKCAFVFLLASAFLSPPDVIHGIFHCPRGVGLLGRPELERVFLSLLGKAVVSPAESGSCGNDMSGASGFVHKPFDCVGTADEVRSVLPLVVRKYEEYASTTAADADADPTRTVALPCCLTAMCAFL